MLRGDDLRPLVEMQRRSYLLLRWMARAVEQGFVRFEAAHDYSTLPEAAESWIRSHYLNIPAQARPALDDLETFCFIFSTYLTNSFELLAAPGKQRYSEGAHCFCPMCSWMADAPNLRTKKLGPRDKRRAQTMRVNVLLNLAAGVGCELSPAGAEERLQDRATWEDASLVAYGYDLISRSKGIATGPAVLALWRGFAWNEAGSPKHRFRLKAELIVQAEQRQFESIQGELE